MPYDTGDEPPVTGDAATPHEERENVMQDVDTRMQQYYLGRLNRMLTKNRHYTAQADTAQNRAVLRLIRQCVYGAVRMCEQLGAADAARALIEQYRARPG